MDHANLMDKWRARGKIRAWSSLHLPNAGVFSFHFSICFSFRSCICCAFFGKHRATFASVKECISHSALDGQSGARDQSTKRNLSVNINPTAGLKYAKLGSTRKILEDSTSCVNREFS